MAFLVLALALFAVDRWSKLAVAAAMPLHSSKSIIPGFFDLVHARNTGIAFSLFADAGPLLKDFILPALSAIAATAVLALFWRSGGEAVRMSLALALILAGAAGNLYDRAAYGYVVDFLDFYVGRWHWPAFNVADSCITVGAILLLIESIAGEGAAQKQREAESA